MPIDSKVNSHNSVSQQGKVFGPTSDMKRSPLNTTVLNGIFCGFRKFKKQDYICEKRVKVDLFGLSCGWLTIM